MKAEKKKQENQLVVQSNDLINAKRKTPYTLNQVKLICHLISHIKPTDENFKTKRIGLSDLGYINCEKNFNYTRLKNEFVELLEKPFKLPGDGGYTNWFSYLKYEDGVIEYAFDNRLKPHLLELNYNFTQYQLKSILSLTSTYSIKLYELLAQYIGIGKRTIELIELRELLNIPNSYRNNDITRLIDSLKKEIHSKTNLKFNFEPIKQSRSFIAIEFTFKFEGKVKTIEELEAPIIEPTTDTISDCYPDGLKPLEYKESTEPIQELKPSLKSLLGNLRVKNGIC